MQQILHRGIAAGVAAAVVGAGLIAITPPPAPPPMHLQEIDVQLTDVFSALSDNVDNIVTDTVNALTAFTQLHLSTAVADLFGAGENVAGIPENLIIAGLAALTGVSPDFLDLVGPIGFSSNVLNTLVAEFVSILINIGVGAEQLFSLDPNAVFSFSGAFDLAVFSVPAELIAGPLLALGL